MAPVKKTQKKRKSRLGRGLSSLMNAPVSVEPPLKPDKSRKKGSKATQSVSGDVTVDVAVASDKGLTVVDQQQVDEGLVWLSVDSLMPNRFQPRDNFDEKALESLARSIKQDGLMQPVVVRKDGQPDRYELVAGERRWRAAKIAKLEVIPAILRELDDRQLAEWAVVENLQREDLDPIERAQAFRRLIDQFDLSHEEVANRVGIERPTVSNSLRLLDLQEDIQISIRHGLISAGHGRALLGISDLELQQVLAQKVIAGAWSVRATEKAVRKATTEPATPAARKKAARSKHLRDLEQQIGQQLSTKATIKPGKSKGSGTLSIEFYDLDQFDDLLAKMGVKIV